MRRSPDSEPHRPLPHRLRGRGKVHLQGSGQAVVTLRGRGTLEIGRLRNTHFHFEGRGARRFPDANHLVIAAAHGVLALTGRNLDVILRDGHVELALTGSFRVVLDGVGEWTTPAGERQRWGLGPRRLDLGGIAAGKPGETV